VYFEAYPRTFDTVRFAVCRYGDLDRVTNLEIQETQVQLLRARKQVGSTSPREGRKEGEERGGRVGERCEHPRKKEKMHAGISPDPPLAKGEENS
jgi:hypothetical protein